MMSEARRLLNENNAQLKEIQKGITAQEALKKTAESKISTLEKLAAEVEMKNISVAIFSKDVDMKISVKYQECVNARYVSGDPYGRSSDYLYEDRSIFTRVTRISVEFSSLQKVFYHQENFKIRLTVDSDVFRSILLNSDFSIHTALTEKDIAEVELSIEKIKEDRELMQVLSFLSKKAR